MPGPGYTSPNNRDSTRSEAYRQMLREKYGIYGRHHYDALNRFKHRKLKTGRA